TRGYGRLHDTCDEALSYCTRRDAGACLSWHAGIPAKGGIRHRIIVECAFGCNVRKPRRGSIADVIHLGSGGCTVKRGQAKQNIVGRSCITYSSCGRTGPESSPSAVSSLGHRSFWGLSPLTNR